MEIMTSKENQDLIKECLRTDDLGAQEEQKFYQELAENMDPNAKPLDIMPEVVEPVKKEEPK